MPSSWETKLLGLVCSMMFLLYAFVGALATTRRPMGGKIILPSFSGTWVKIRLAGLSKV